MITNNTPIRVNGYGLLCFALSVLVPVTLITGKAFMASSLTSLFLYLGLSSMVVMAAGLLFIQQKKQRYYLTLPVIIFIFWFIYIALQAVLLHSFHLFHYYLLSDCGLFFSLFFLLSRDRRLVRILLVAILFSAVIESLICISQYAGILKSLNVYFPVTGTWENPNVTAMFLTVAAPALFYTWFTVGKKLQKLIILGVLSIAAALIMLACRTALIGFVLEAVILFAFKFDVSKKIKANKTRAVFLLLFIVGITIPIATGLYRSKQASADGRKLIWKISARMLFSGPVYGYGYGNFEHSYNLFQARYFEQGKGVPAERKNAGFVHMAYNELLQNGIEGGIAGALLLAMIFGSLLAVPVFKSKNTERTGAGLKAAIPGADQHHIDVAAYSGLAAFVLMSLCNFSLQAIPAMAVFIVYAAILSGHPGLKRYYLGGNAVPATTSQPVYYLLPGALIMLAGLAMCFQTVTVCYYNLLNKTAKVEAGKGNTGHALNLVETIEGKLDADDSYWTNYGNIRLSLKDYPNAILCYNRAKLLTSDPQIYIKAAQCEVMTGDLPAARRDLLIAANIEPNYITPRYQLMKLYLQLNDTAKTMDMARYIRSIVPKVSSAKASRYQNETDLLMKKLGHQDRRGPVSESMVTINTNYTDKPL